MKTGKIVLIGTGVVVAAGAFFYVRKGSAAEKLQLDFSNFKVALKGNDFVSGLGKLVTLPTQVVATVEFNAINPSGEELKFITPYVTLTTDTKTDPKIIGHSTPSAEQIVIPARGSRLIPVTIKIPLTSMLAIFPDYIQYAWGRLHDEPSTRKLIAKYDYTAYGINLTDQSVVNL